MWLFGDDKKEFLYLVREFALSAGKVVLYYLIKEKKAKFNKGLVDKKLKYIGKSFSLSDFRIALNEKGSVFEKELAN